MSNPGLQDRRRRQTEGEIGAAALRLFEERGVERTTVDDIAREAGVSARTVFRYFPTKERAALVAHRDLEDRAEEMLDVLDPTTPLLPQLERVWREVLAALDDGRSEAGQQVLRVRRLMHAEPSIQLAAIGIDEERVEALVARITADGADEFGARLLVETGVAVLRTVLDVWAREEDHSRTGGLVATYDHACRRLRVIVS